MLHFHQLFDTLPASACVTDAYIRFLYHVGEQSLPDSFVGLHQKVRTAEAITLIQYGNSRYRLEVLLQRYVYAKPLLLKQRGPLREGVLSLLEDLIALGSSAAFRMRDDFVTPLSA